MRHFDTFFNIIHVLCSEIILKWLSQQLHNNFIQKHNIMSKACYTFRLFHPWWGGQPQTTQGQIPWKRRWRSAIDICLQVDHKYYYAVTCNRAWGGVVVKALRYYSDGLGIDSRWCHWGFFPYVRTEPCALVSMQPLKVSTTDFSWDKGGRCVWLTTYNPRSAERQEYLGP